MLNSSVFYQDLGRKAAQARNQRDEARAQFHAVHFRRARDLESAEDRPLVTEWYMSAYRASRHP